MDINPKDLNYIPSGDIFAICDNYQLITQISVWPIYLNNQNSICYEPTGIPVNFLEMDKAIRFLEKSNYDGIIIFNTRQQGGSINQHQIIHLWGSELTQYLNDYLQLYIDCREMLNIVSNKMIEDPYNYILKNQLLDLQSFIITENAFRHIYNKYYRIPKDGEYWIDAPACPDYPNRRIRSIFPDQIFRKHYILSYGN